MVNPSFPPQIFTESPLFPTFQPKENNLAEIKVGEIGMRFQDLWGREIASHNISPIPLANERIIGGNMAGYLSNPSFTLFILLGHISLALASFLRQL